MMKQGRRILSFVLAFAMVLTTMLATDLTSVDVKAADSTIQITESSGWFEAAYVEWKHITGATEYRAYVKKAGGSYTQLDDMLLRQYSGYWRADAVGLAAGTYQLKVEAKVNGSFISAETGELTVKAFDRSGFAFSKNSPTKGEGIGAYNNDGTLKAGAQVLYVTEDTKNTVQMEINGKTYTGVAAITQAIKEKNGCPPVAIRIIGKVTLPGIACSDMSSAYAIGVKQASNVTIEGIGEDATLYEAGAAAFDCNSIEVRNLGLMNWGDDGVTLKETINAWIHHVDFFYGAKGSDADQIKGDGSMDLKDNSQYVTISHNHFWDSGKMSLCGMKSESGPNWISYHHNWFDHSDSRHPRIRTMSVHVYNNYFDGVSKYGVGAAKSGEAFVENNYFRNCKYPMLSAAQGSDIGSGDSGGTFSGEDGGVIKSYNNYMVGQKAYVTYQQNNVEFDAYEASSRDEKVPSTVKAKQGGKTYSNFDTDSSIMYDYTVDPVEDVPTLVMANSGRMNGGDFTWEFNDAVDDESYALNQALRNALNAYVSPVVSIGGGDTSNPTDLKGILISPSSKTLLAGKTVQLSVSPSTSQATLDGRTITYTSSNKGVATVSDTGLVTAVAIGTATITARVDDFTADCTITVSAPVELAGIKINQTNPTVQAGRKITLTASATNDTTDSFTVTWSSGDTTKATVDTSTGEVTGVAEGTAEITATATTTSGIKKTATVTVNVTAAPPIPTGGYIHNFTTQDKTSDFYTIEGDNLKTGLNVSYGSLTLTKALKMNSHGKISFTAGQAGKLTMVFDPTERVGSGFTLLIDSQTVEIPTSGIVEKELAAGTYEIARVQGESYLVYIAFEPSGPVKPVEVESVKVTPSVADVVEGKTLQLNATVLPALAADKTVSWSSSSEAVAKVDTNGVVTAVAPGTATITASSKSAPSIKGVCEIRVVASSSAEETTEKIELSSGLLAGTTYGKANSMTFIVGQNMPFLTQDSGGNSTAKEIDGVSYPGYVQGTSNSTLSGDIPNGGAYFKFTPVVDVRLDLVMNATTKTYVFVNESGSEAKISGASIPDKLSFNMKAGEIYYFYAVGSKPMVYAMSYTYQKVNLPTTYTATLVKTGLTGADAVLSKSAFIEASDSVTLTITPDSGYTFAEAPKVTADNAKAGNVVLQSDGSYKCIINGFTGNTKVTVTGEAKTTEYNVTIDSTGLTGAKAAADKTKASSKDEVVVTITPEAGKEFKTAPTVTLKAAGTATVGAVTKAAGSDAYTCKVTNVKAATTLVVKGAATEKTVTVKVNVNVENDGNGKASADKTQVEKNTTVKLTAVPNAGYSFDKWVIVSGTGAVIADSTAAETTLTVGTSDVSVKATFKKNNVPADETKIRAFVTKLYTVVLNRQPDENGINDWTERLVAGTQNGATTSYGFVFSDEFQNRNISNSERVDIMYRTFLDREADAEGKKMWVDALDSGVGIEKIYEGFVMSTEFAACCAEYGISAGQMSDVPGMIDKLNLYRNRNLNVTAFVARCYTKALGRERDIDGIEMWCRLIITGEWTPRNVAADGFFHSDEFKNKNTTNAQYVSILYETFLGRTLDAEGNAMWVGLLDRNEWTRDEVLDGFANSDEFAGILASFGLN